MSRRHWQSNLPITRFWYRGRPSCCEASPLLPRRGSSSLVPGCRCASLSAIFVSFNAGDGNVLCCAVDVLLELSSRQPKWMMTSLYQTVPQTITTRHDTALPLTTATLLRMSACGDDSHLPLVHYASFVTDDV